MIEELRELYIDSGAWAQPILISTLALFVAGWVMMFTVRMVKRFVLFSIVALLLPNTIGIVGYLEEADSIQEAVIERSEDISDEVQESIEEVRFSPIYLGAAGSVLTVLVGLGGIVRLKLKHKKGPAEKEA